MKYIVENNKLIRILDDGSKQKLGWVTDNGRGDAIAVNVSPIKEKWLMECEKYGIPSHKENEPIPFWDDGKDINRAFEEFYKDYAQAESTGGHQ